MQPQINPSDQEYRGYRLLWTGWKTICNQFEFVGQWLAVPKDSEKSMLHSCSSGAIGHYRRCQTMDLTHFEDAKWISLESSQIEMDEVMNNARRRLENFIDAELEGKGDEFILSLYPWRKDYANL